MLLSINFLGASQSNKDKTYIWQTDLADERTTWTSLMMNLSVSRVPESSQNQTMQWIKYESWKLINTVTVNGSKNKGTFYPTQCTKKLLELFKVLSFSFFFFQKAGFFFFFFFKKIKKKKKNFYILFLFKYN
jgi:hypothetical protein